MSGQNLCTLVVKLPYDFINQLKTSPHFCTADLPGAQVVLFVFKKTVYFLEVLFQFQPVDFFTPKVVGLLLDYTCFQLLNLMIKSILELF